ncbi:hypothetical protein MBLNU459_g2170t2 [Dothideomycetes sp. NU459]
MVVQLSIRKSLRWIPDEPSEPTDTLVLDVGDYFVDLRVLKSNISIDWAMAGKRTVLRETPLRCQWSKEICSMGTEDSDDVGDFEDLPNGDALEKGSMPNPEKNDEVTEYEEVWGSLPVPSSEQPAWILRNKDESGITYLGRVGSYYQALRKSQEGSFAALREECVSGSWNVKYAIKGDALPSIAQLGQATFDGKSWSLGQEVSIGGLKYSVIALERA